MTALAAAVVKRRGEELGLTQKELAERAGVSRYTVQAIERAEGRHLLPETRAKLEDALELERDSISDVLHGRGPLRARGSVSIETVEQPFDVNTASYEQLGQHSEWLSSTSGDSTLGPRWMAAVLEKRFKVKNSPNEDDEGNRHAM